MAAWAACLQSTAKSGNSAISVPPCSASLCRTVDSTKSAGRPVFSTPPPRASSRLAAASASEKRPTGAPTGSQTARAHPLLPGRRGMSQSNHSPAFFWLLGLLLACFAGPSIASAESAAIKGRASHRVELPRASLHAHERF